ncbi:hypothetical protein [Streptomyces sp. NPDC058613]|uniref:hypothetical protein n=1 Tax=unclassified Streptomyces TaxID=2593676 RepID=UPI0036670429
MLNGTGVGSGGEDGDAGARDDGGSPSRWRGVIWFVGSGLLIMAGAAVWARVSPVWAAPLEVGLAAGALFLGAVAYYRRR